jgi:large subunit ribosomal protein L10
LPTPKKAETIDELSQLFESSIIAIWTDYRGLSVGDITNLRNQLRQAGAEFHVAKNTLTRIATERLGIEGLDAFLAGPTAIAFSTEEVARPAKVLRDFARTSRILTVKGALIGRSVIGAESVADLSDLPSRDQLRAQLAGNIQGPLAGIVGALDSVLSNMVYTLDERGRQLSPEAAA